MISKPTRGKKLRQVCSSVILGASFNPAKSILVSVFGSFRKVV